MIFDGHSDILTDLTIRYEKGDTNPFVDRHLESLKKGGINGSIFVIWPEPPNDSRPFQRSKEILKSLDREVEKKNLRLVTSYSELDRYWGKEFCVFLGAEGLSSIENNPEYLNELYMKGLRHCSLTWNESNGLATGVTGDPNRGLTELGEETVKCIEDMGIILDVSHLNEKSFWDLTKVASGPIIASHSNLRKLSDHPRNLTDDQVRAIGESGGLVGINAYRDFVSLDPTLQNIRGYVNHVVETCNLIGVEHVALGFDFFGYLESDTIDSFSSDIPNIQNLEDVSKVENVVEALFKTEFTRDEIDMICYKNYFNLIKKVIG